MEPVVLYQPLRSLRGPCCSHAALQQHNRLLLDHAMPDETGKRATAVSRP